jgi:hypothetical protein
LKSSKGIWNSKGRERYKDKFGFREFDEFEKHGRASPERDRRAVWSTPNQVHALAACYILCGCGSALDAERYGMGRQHGFDRAQFYQCSNDYIRRLVRGNRSHDVMPRYGVERRGFS